MVRIYWISIFMIPVSVSYTHLYALGSKMSLNIITIFVINEKNVIVNSIDDDEILINDILGADERNRVDSL